jgi:hypothetical protein
VRYLSYDHLKESLANLRNNIFDGILRVEEVLSFTEFFFCPSKYVDKRIKAHAENTI